MNPSTDDLLSQLDRSGLGQEELQVILGAHFPKAVMAAAQNVTYCRADESPVVNGVFKGELLVGLIPDASMTADELAELKGIIASASAERDERLHTSAIFTRLPLREWWRYRDRFQLRPPPTDPPTSDNLAGPHPAYFDVMARTSAYPILRVARLQAQRRQVELLLNLFMQLPLVTESKRLAVWVCKGTVPELRSEIRQPGYFTPGLGWPMTAALPPVVGEPAPAVPDGEYYSRRGHDAGDSLDFPTSMAQMFDAFYALRDADQHRFLKACFWYREGSRRDSQSTTYLTLITAIEVMQPKQGGPVERCDCCGKKRIGPTKLFAEFLERHAPGGTNKQRQALYEHRSKLSHGDVLIADRMFIWGLSPDQWRDDELEERARKTVQLALINWLLETTGNDPLDLALTTPSRLISVRNVPPRWGRSVIGSCTQIRARRRPDVVQMLCTEPNDDVLHEDDPRPNVRA